MTFTVILSGTRNDPGLLIQDRVKYILGTIRNQLCPAGGLLKHGDARGIDTFGSYVWDSMGDTFICESFPYESSRGPAGGPYRNQQMVDSGGDLFVGFPVAESRGTYDCFRRARSAGINSFLFRTLQDVRLFEAYVSSLTTLRV